MKVSVGYRIPGSARVSRAGFGVPPKQSFLQQCCQEKVRDREDAITSTRDACATQSSENGRVLVN
jgi:hypothetical protein